MTNYCIHLIPEGRCFVCNEKQQENSGIHSDYYQLPDNATELQDLIEAKDMNFSVGNMFKAVYRLGNCTHSDKKRDLEKVIFFASRQLALLERGSE